LQSNKQQQQQHTKKMKLILLVVLCVLSAFAQQARSQVRNQHWADIHRQAAQLMNNAQQAIQNQAEELMQNMQTAIEAREQELLAYNEGYQADADEVDSRRRGARGHGGTVRRARSLPSLLNLESENGDDDDDDDDDDNNQNSNGNTDIAPSRTSSTRRACICVAGGAVAVAVRYYLAHNDQARICVQQTGQCIQHQCQRVLSGGARALIGTLKTGQSVCGRVLSTGRRVALSPVGFAVRQFRRVTNRPEEELDTDQLEEIARELFSATKTQRLRAYPSERQQRRDF
jgi:hypothetical protein